MCISITPSLPQNFSPNTFLLCLTSRDTSYESALTNVKWNQLFCQKQIKNILLSYWVGKFYAERGSVCRKSSQKLFGGSFYKAERVRSFQCLLYICVGGLPNTFLTALALVQRRVQPTQHQYTTFQSRRTHMMLKWKSTIPPLTRCFFFSLYMEHGRTHKQFFWQYSSNCYQQIDVKPAIPKQLNVPITDQTSNIAYTWEFLDSSPLTSSLAF